MNIVIGSSRDLGGCGNCSRHHQVSGGMEEHQVLRITFRDFSVISLCDECRKQLHLTTGKKLKP